MDAAEGPVAIGLEDEDPVGTVGIVGIVDAVDNMDTVDTVNTAFGYSQCTVSD